MCTGSWPIGRPLYGGWAYGPAFVRQHSGRQLFSSHLWNISIYVYRCGLVLPGPCHNIFSILCGTAQ